MAKDSSSDRMAENEAIFRQYNERVQRGLKDLETMATEHNQEGLIDDLDVPLHFHCECHDPLCNERVPVKPEEYEKIHNDRKQFIVLCGHDNPEIEEVIKEKDEYCVVRKKVRPPEHPLNK